MTWILPKQLHTSASALDTEALSLDSSEQSQICAQSLFVRSKPSPVRTWSAKWKRDSWTQHLSGRILRPSLGQLFVTKWTSSLEATHASPLVQPGSAEAKTIQGTCGPISQTAFDFSDPESASLRTSKDISAWGCPTSSKTWQEWVTERRGAYSARLNAERLTRESESSSWPIAQSTDSQAACLTEKRLSRSKGTQLREAVHGHPAPASSSTDGSRQGLSWPTPQTMDVLPVRPVETFAESNRTRGGRKNRQALSNLREAIHSPVYQVKQWQTATVSTGAHKQKDGSMIDKLDQQVKSWATPRAEHDSGAHKGKPDTLHSQIKNWATPNCPSPHDSDNTAGSLHVTKKQVDLVRNLQLETGSKSGKLNARWCETLMGLPVGWTMPSCVSPVTIERMSCDCLETELSQQLPI